MPASSSPSLARRPLQALPGLPIAVEAKRPREISPGARQSSDRITGTARYLLPREQVGCHDRSFLKAMRERMQNAGGPPAGRRRRGWLHASRRFR
jgi:hypothetical protein